MCEPITVGSIGLLICDACAVSLLTVILRLCVLNVILVVGSGTCLVWGVRWSSSGSCSSICLSLLRIIYVGVAWVGCGRCRGRGDKRSGR